VLVLYHYLKLSNQNNPPHRIEHKAMPFQNIDKHDANPLCTSSTVLTQITVIENMHLIPDTCYVILYMLYEEKL